MEYWSLFNEESSLTSIEREAIFKKPMHFEMMLTGVKQKFQSLENQIDELEARFKRRIDQIIQDKGAE